MKKIFFLKKTLYLGSSLSDFNSIRKMLEIHGIPYQYKYIDLEHNSYLGMNGVTRSLGDLKRNVTQSCLYEILVRKDQYDFAKKVISKII